MDSYPITGRSLELFFHVDGGQLDRQYKEHLSDYLDWIQKEHASEYVLFPENIGARMSIDETSVSNGELYTILSNKDARGRKGCIAAIVLGTKSEDVERVLDKIAIDIREKVEEVTMDMSNSMRKIIRHSFPKATRVIDRFHIQKLACDAVQEMRIKYRWEAIQEETDAMEEAKGKAERYKPELLANGDTKKQLLARSRYLLFKSVDKWTQSQKERAEILFSIYPDLKKAYGLSHSLRMIFSKNTIKDAARVSLAKWYNQVEEAGFDSFNVIAATLYEHYNEILNFFNNRATNASAESLNAKIKAFRASLRGVCDIPFFMFRLTNIYA